MGGRGGGKPVCNTGPVLSGIVDHTFSDRHIYVDLTIDVDIDIYMSICSDQHIYVDRLDQYQTRRNLQNIQFRLFEHTVPMKYLPLALHSKRKLWGH